MKNDKSLRNENFECKNENRSKYWTPPSTTDYKGNIDPSVNFTYADPETYKGPVVQGWEPGKLAL